MHEIDGEGHIKVYSFTVAYTDADTQRFVQTTRHFTDYERGWSWATEEGSGLEECDAISGYNVDWDFDWMTPEELEEIQDCEE